ncbi:Uncharacterised protein [Mycoplasmopsis edwardii]|uniref:Uncharacterized protein n=1 Tax=Mycoplasmopsis edwardii TaxID=53558 RepID=A0A3B0PLR3_9BACT|nr:Uncharacterised protein [Mycoplasmopsis edwardii]
MFLRTEVAKYSFPFWNALDWSTSTPITNLSANLAFFLISSIVTDVAGPATG